MVFVGIVGYQDAAPMELGWFFWIWSVTKMPLLWSLVGSRWSGRLARCRSYGAWLVFVGMVGYQGIAPMELGWFSLVWSVTKMPLLWSLVGPRGHGGYRDGAPMEFGWFLWAWSVSKMPLLWSLVGFRGHGRLPRYRSYGAWLVLVGMVS